MDMLKVEVTNFRIVGKNMIGNLEYMPYHLFVDDYIFREGDMYVDTGDNYCYIEISDDYLFELAYNV